MRITFSFAKSVLVVIAAFAASCSVGAADAGAAPNACARTGLTTAVMTKIFGAGTKCEQGYVVKNPGLIGQGEVAISPAEGVTVDLYAKSYLQTWLKADALSSAYVRPLKLGGLGGTAGLFNSTDYNYCSLYFTAGTYTVLMQTNGALATNAADGVTKQQIVALAHAIHAHLG